MKRLAIIVCFLLSLVSYIQAQEVIVERPRFLARSSADLEIDKVVLSDTATVLHIKAFYRPKYWIKIASGTFLKGNDGELYRLRQGIGITPDQEFWMPESGQAEFKLVFPPLPKHVATVDFSEGDIEGAFKIWGIRLKGDFPKLNLPEAATTRVKKLATLPIPKIEKGMAVLEGQMLGFVPGMQKQITCYPSSALNLTQEINLTLSDDGSFSSEIPVASVTPAIIYIGSQAINILLAPGEKTQVFMNPREIHRRQSRLHKEEKSDEAIAYYGGYMAGISREIARLEFKSAIDADFYAFIQDLKGKNAEEVKAYILGKQREKLQAIDALKASGACKELLRCTVDVSAASLLSVIPMIIQRVYIINNNLKDDAINEYIKNNPIDLPEHYYDVLKEFSVINTPQALYAPAYPRLVQSSSFKEAFGKALNTEKGIYFDLYFVAEVLNNIKAFIPATEEQLAQISALSTPIYSEIVKAKNTELLAKIEQNKKKTGFKVNETGEVSNEDLFASIIAKYRGKVILVDFWATWCGPCRTANKAMLPMKEELKDKDIVYIYLTGESSPKGTWENMIPDIHGEHFRFTADQWAYLMKSFNVEGVPTYILVDREGNISYRTTGFPGIDKMKGELLKAIDNK